MKLGISCLSTLPAYSGRGTRFVFPGFNSTHLDDVKCKEDMC